MFHVTENKTGANKIHASNNERETDKRRKKKNLWNTEKIGEDTK